jgi:hypothetical protein
LFMTSAVGRRVKWDGRVNAILGVTREAGRRWVDVLECAGAVTVRCRIVGRSWGGVKLKG